MRAVISSYDNPVTEAIWAAFMDFFREIKGYDDWTDEEIALSMNEDDIDEFIQYIKDNLSYDRREDK